MRRSVIEGVSPLDYRKHQSALGFARKEQHDCGLARDLLGDDIA